MTELVVTDSPSIVSVILAVNTYVPAWWKVTVVFLELLRAVVAEGGRGRAGGRRDRPGVRQARFAVDGVGAQHRERRRGAGLAGDPRLLGDGRGRIDRGGRHRQRGPIGGIGVLARGEIHRPRSAPGREITPNHETGDAVGVETAD